MSPRTNEFGNLCQPNKILHLDLNFHTIMKSGTLGYFSRAIYTFTFYGFKLEIQCVGIIMNANVYVEIRRK